MVPGTPPDDLVELGRVSGAYGVQGWIKIEPHAAQSQVLLRVREWWLRRDDAPSGGLPPGGVASNGSPPDGSPPGALATAVRVVKSRTQGSTIVAQLAGVSDRDLAAALRGNRVWVSRAAFPAADPDEYYWVDLIGCLLYGHADDVPVLIGRVSEITDNGAHAVLHVTRLLSESELVPVLDDKGREEETLVPFVAAHVQAVDLAARRIDTDWPAEL